MINERNILIWLNYIGGITYETILDFKFFFGELEEIWDVNENHLYQVLPNNKKIVERILRTRNKDFLQRIINDDKKDYSIITILDESYPKKLKNIYNPPYVLYIIGDKSIKSPLIAIVGARKSTAYGRWAAKKFAKELADWDIGVISGLALGIDAEGHKGALTGDGYTIAVLGCGIDQCYPKSNYNLYCEIREKGSIISEYPPGVEPLKHHFPARNRIISGLSDGVIVIEAGERSGTLITVQHALDQGKDIYSLPGNINSSQSKGTNKLIREGAKILLSVEDIIEELQYKYTLKNIKKDNNLQMDLSNDEMQIYNIIKENPIHIDLIAYKSGKSVSEVNMLLTILELKGIINQLPGKIFVIAN
ncbi:MAG: DNA-protecting protein DprA [Clostridiales bacterium]|nr:DNA-protecting protein DprA [Clostridiales bacterium]